MDDVITIDLDKDIVDSDIDNNGRPCKYESHVKPYLDKVYQWLCEGRTEYSIADQLGIHRHTLIKYKERYADLIDIFTRARTERNKLVYNAMFKKAIGEKVVLNKQKVTKDGDVIDITEEMYIPPDVNAADLTLRNSDDNYKSAKMDTSNLTLIQNNFQLPQLQAEIAKIEQELKKLESADTTTLQGDK